MSGVYDVNGTPITEQAKTTFKTGYTFGGTVATKTYDTVTTVPDGGLYINADPTVIKQDFISAGAAITDSAAYVLKTYLSASARKTLFEEVFGAENGYLKNVRVCIGSSDFRSTSTAYTYCDSEDYTLASFSIGSNGSTPTKDYVNVIPILKEIVAVNPDIKVIGAVWSPPAWMKTNGSLIQGNFDYTSENATAFATYLVKFVQAYKAEGINIYGISPQNEPDLANPFPSCVWTGANLADFCGNYLAPALIDAELYDVRILIFDANIQSSSLPMLNAILSASESRFIDGYAFHAYKDGTMPAIITATKGITKELYYTERRTLLNDSTATKIEVMMKGLVDFIKIGGKWISLWNFALDQSGNPTQGSTGRQGVITVNNSTHAVTRNLEYFMLWALSANVDYGAKVFDTQDYINDSIKSVGLVMPNGDVTLLVCNYGTSTKTVYVEVDGTIYEVSIPSYSFAKFDAGVTISTNTPSN